MNIREVIQTLNQMQSDGVVGRCAIGGAVGATFYLEPFATLDVDIFVTMRPEPGRLLLSLEPIFDYLKARGCTIEGTVVRVFTADHLAAIALQNGRAKDKSRLLQFVESGRLPTTAFQQILQRHGLQEKWQRFTLQFLSDS